jgi:hypothetical protein
MEDEPLDVRRRMFMHDGAPFQHGLRRISKRHFACAVDWAQRFFFVCSLTLPVSPSLLRLGTSQTPRIGEKG